MLWKVDLNLHLLPVRNAALKAVGSFKHTMYVSLIHFRYRRTKLPVDDEMGQISTEPEFRHRIDHLQCVIKIVQVSVAMRFE